VAGAVDFHEFVAVEVEHRPVHRSQHAVGNVGRAGILEELASPWPGVHAESSLILLAAQTIPRAGHLSRGAEGIAGMSMMPFAAGMHTMRRTRPRPPRFGVAIMPVPQARGMMARTITRNGCIAMDQPKESCMTDTPTYGFETLSIHAGAAPDPTTGSRALPIHQTSAYVFEDADHAAALFNLQTVGFIYSRLTNPTTAALEARLAALEGGRGATVTSSGHAAQVLALFPLMSPGDEVVASTKLYGGSIQQMRNTYPKFGWKAVFVDPDDPENFRKAVTPRTRAFFIESLANPGGVVCDIEAIAKVAESAGVPLLVDNTLASPYLCRPIEWGATLVLHSTTKFLCGTGTTMGGAIVDSGKFDWSRGGKFPSLAGPEPAYHGLNFYETFGDMAYTFHGHAVGLRDLGPSQAPMNAWITMLGMETLALRMERHCANAQKVAEHLEAHPAVAWVNYAGLPSNKYNALARKYLPKGAGSVFTFGLKGGYEAGVKLVDSVELFSHLANIGDAKSLIIHPASTTHRQLSDEQQVAAGAGPDVVRLSIGIESVADIIADLDQALTKATSGMAKAAE
jgi:O-acetylhomoserine (thiol)-lyase